MSSQATSRQSPATDCTFCAQPGGRLLWQDAFARVVLAAEADHPAFCRVILNRHAKEMTDLSSADRERLMGVVFAVEAALRKLLDPDKINLASLGNQVPHLHWHVIARFKDDPHFPNPVWGPRTGGNARELPDAVAARLSEELGERLRTGLS
jgi:diadenosine tetraphosphate (Ap4A) HIT family hydrolase